MKFVDEHIAKLLFFLIKVTQLSNNTYFRDSTTAFLSIYLYLPHMYLGGENILREKNKFVALTQKPLPHLLCYSQCGLLFIFNSFIINNQTVASLIFYQLIKLINVPNYVFV